MIEKKRAERGSVFLKVILGTLVFIVAVIQILPFFLNESFPEIPNGTYLGKISGIIPRREKEHNFYFKHFKEPSSFLFVVFKDNWGAKRISFSSSSRKNKIFLKDGDRNYQLVGIKEARGYQGKVLLDGEEVGLWSLEQTEEKIPEIVDEPNFVAWLKDRTEYEELSESLVSIQKTKTESEGQAKKLRNFLSEDKLISEQDKEPSIELKNQLLTEAEKRKIEKSELEHLVAELELKSRLAPESIEASLERKIRKREAKWFRAIWDDSSSWRASIADTMNVESELIRGGNEESLHLARLQAEIKTEKARIKELEETLAAKSLEQEPRERKREVSPWWPRF